MKFKIGDRVHVYGFNKINPSQVIIKTINSITDGGMLICEQGFYLHPKTCRRLVKKPKRRIWLTVSAASEKTLYHGEDDILFTPPTADICDDPADWVEFIEVRKK